MIKLYGINNCDTIKKAKKYLDENKLSYEFHDYKKLGIDATKLANWCDEFGFSKVINKRGTTWRKLSEAQKADMDQDKAIALMMEQTSLIKRPLLETGTRRILGFDQSSYQSLL